MKQQKKLTLQLRCTSDANMRVQVHDPRGHPRSFSIDHFQVHASRLKLLEQGKRNITDGLDEATVHKQVASEDLVPSISCCPDCCIAHKNGRLRVLNIAVTLGTGMEMGYRPGFGACIGAFGEDLGTMGVLMGAGMGKCGREW